MKIRSTDLSVEWCYPHNLFKLLQWSVCRDVIFYQHIYSVILADMMDIRCTVLEMQCALASYIISVWSYIISWQRWIWTIRRFHSPFDFLWNRCVFEGQDCQWAGIQWKSEIPVLQCAVLRDSVMMVLLYISGPWPGHPPMRKWNGLYRPMRAVEIHAPPIHQWSVAALSELTSWIHNRGHQANHTGHCQWW